jgi:hypothetical protein
MPKFTPVCEDLLIVPDDIAAGWWRQLGATDITGSQSATGLADVLARRREELWERFKLLSRLRVELLSNEYRCIAELQHLAEYLQYDDDDDLGGL